MTADLRMIPLSGKRRFRTRSEVVTPQANSSDWRKHSHPHAIHCEFMSRTNNSPPRRKTSAHLPCSPFGRARRRSVSWSLILAVAVLAGCSGAKEEIDTTWDPRPEAYRPPPAIVAQPPIIEPEVVRIADVDPLFIRPDDLVVGIEIDGEARAYSLNHMDHMQRTVINDVVADQPIAVTLSRNALCVQVFKTGTDADEAMTLQTTNRAWQGSELLIDAQSQTHWCQVLGVGLHGPRKGEYLPRLPCVIIDWATWSQSHPNTLVTKMPPMIRRFHRLYMPQTAGRFTVGLVEPGAPVRAWRLDQLLYQPMHQETWNNRPILVCYHDHSGAVTVFDRDVDGQILDFQWRGDRLTDHQTGSIWDPVTGRATAGPLVDRRLKPRAVTHLRDFFWRKYFPDSDYWACPDTLFFGGQCAESAVWEASRGTPCHSPLVINAIDSVLSDRSMEQTTAAAASEPPPNATPDDSSPAENRIDQAPMSDRP